MTFTEKSGTIARGISVAAAVTVLTSAGLLVGGIAVSLFAQETGWVHLGEYQPWIPIIGLEYGFFLGLLAGIVTGWRVIRNRLRANHESAALLTPESK
jgi:hypothetical protein